MWHRSLAKHPLITLPNLVAWWVLLGHLIHWYFTDGSAWNGPWWAWSILVALAFVTLDVVTVSAKLEAHHEEMTRERP